MQNYSKLYVDKGNTPKNEKSQGNKVLFLNSSKGLIGKKVGIARKNTGENDKVPSLSEFSDEGVKENNPEALNITSKNAYATKTSQSGSFYVKAVKAGGDSSQANQPRSSNKSRSSNEDNETKENSQIAEENKSGSDEDVNSTKYTANNMKTPEKSKEAKMEFTLGVFTPENKPHFGGMTDSVVTLGGDDQKNKNVQSIQNSGVNTNNNISKNRLDTDPQERPRYDIYLLT